MERGWTWGGIDPRVEDTSAKNKSVAMKSLAIQGVFLLVSLVGMKSAPPPPKKKKP